MKERYHMKRKVFISHSEVDKSIAELICVDLENKDISCWIAPRDIPYGNDWAGEIASAIENSSLFLFILSEHSNISRQCPKEVTIADNAGIPIVCVKIDDVVMNQAFKYHFSVQQTLILDASRLEKEIKLITSAISNKLSSTIGNCDDFTYNIDNELDKRYTELFAIPDKDSDTQTEDIKNSITEILVDLLSHNFMDKFLKKLDVGEKGTRRNAKTQVTTKKFLLSPSKWTECGDKHFSLPLIENTKTIVFQIFDIIDYATKSKVSNCLLLRSVENDGFVVFSPYKPPADGSDLLILNFNQSDKYISILLGVIYLDRIQIVKEPITMLYHPNFTVNDDVPFLNDVAYEKDNATIKHTKNSKTTERWFDADIKSSSVIIIDPEKAEPVRRKVYYDDKKKCMRAKILLSPYKNYFSFQLKDDETNATSVPLSFLEQGIYYRKGLHGFPKNLVEAAQLFEKDGSKESLYELALLFKEPGVFNNHDAYIKFLLRSVEQGCEKAIIELSLGVSFREHSYKTIDECIELLKTVKDSSSEGNFVLAYLLENDDPKESFDCFLKAAKNEYAPALSRLHCSDYTLDGQSEDELYVFFMKSHNENQGLLEYCMGCACFYGYNIETRKKIGIDLIKKSAYLGDYDSEQLLFDIFDSDDEYSDKSKALFWLKKIATHDESILIKLADWYIDGIGCEQSNDNDRKAFTCLSTLEQSNMGVAINNLAWLYKVGRGCEQNYIRAKELFERAAEMNCTSSYYHLGTMYEEGLGIDVNHVLAKKMYEIAAKKGHNKSAKRLSSIIL